MDKLTKLIVYIEKEGQLISNINNSIITYTYNDFLIEVKPSTTNDAIIITAVKPLENDYDYKKLNILNCNERIGRHYVAEVQTNDEYAYVYTLVLPIKKDNYIDSAINILSLTHQNITHAFDYIRIQNEKYN